MGILWPGQYGMALEPCMSKRTCDRPSCDTIDLRWPVAPKLADTSKGWLLSMLAAPWPNLQLPSDGPQPCAQPHVLHEPSAPLPGCVCSVETIDLTLASICHDGTRHTFVRFEWLQDKGGLQPCTPGRSRRTARPSGCRNIASPTHRAAAPPRDTARRCTRTRRWTRRRRSEAFLSGVGACRTARLPTFQQAASPGTHAGHHGA